LVSVRRVEAAERERHAVAQRHDAGDVKAVQTDLRLDPLCPELLDAEPGSGAAERRVEAVTVDVAVALDLDGGPGREPGREALVDTERELVEPEVDLARRGAGGRSARELGVAWEG